MAIIDIGPELLDIRLAKDNAVNDLTIALKDADGNDLTDYVPTMTIRQNGQTRRAVTIGQGLSKVGATTTIILPTDLKALAYRHTIEAVISGRLFTLFAGEYRIREPWEPGGDTSVFDYTKVIGGSVSINVTLSSKGPKGDAGEGGDLSAYEGPVQLSDNGNALRINETSAFLEADSPYIGSAVVSATNNGSEDIRARLFATSSDLTQQSVVEVKMESALIKSDSIILQGPMTLLMATEPATPATDSVALWFDGTELRAKKADGSIVTIF